MNNFFFAFSALFLIWKNQTATKNREKITQVVVISGYIYKIVKLIQSGVAVFFFWCYCGVWFKSLIFIFCPSVSGKNIYIGQYVLRIQTDQSANINIECQQKQKQQWRRRRTPVLHNYMISCASVFKWYLIYLFEKKCMKYCRAHSRLTLSCMNDDGLTALILTAENEKKKLNTYI